MDIHYNMYSIYTVQCIQYTVYTVYFTVYMMYINMWLWPIIPSKGYVWVDTNVYRVQANFKIKNNYYKCQTHTHTHIYIYI